MDDETKKRVAAAKAAGWNEDTIAKMVYQDVASKKSVSPDQSSQGTSTIQPIKKPVQPQPTQKNTDISQPITTDGAFSQPSNITGHSLIDHSRALEKAKAAGDKNAIKSIQDSYDREFAYQKEYGVNQKQKDSQIARQDSLQKAKELLDVLDQGKAGKLTGKQYKDALNLAASSYTASKAFGEGGKNLTANELAVLSGQLPVIKQKVGTPLERFGAWAGGYKVPQTGELADSEATVRNKITRVINTLDPNAKIPYPTGNEIPQKQKETLNPNIIENALNEVVGLVKATPDMIKKVYDLTLPGQVSRSLQGRNVGKEDLQTAKDFIGGLVDDLSKTSGISMDKTGYVKFDPGAALTHDWNHPLGTLAYLASFLKVAKGIKGAELAGKAATAGGEAAATDAAGAFPKMPPTNPAEIGAIKGRMLTSVAAPVSESVKKSELLMRDAMQITKAPSIRGMAKELEGFVPKTGNNIADYAKKLDKVIGLQPVEEITNTVLDKLKNNSVAQTNPEMASTINKILSDKLEVGQLPGGLQQGQPFATTIEKINETRKFLNSSISNKWFENGQPLTSAADQLNSLKWDASNALKDIMIEADKSGGYFNKAINLQHSALSTAPILSQAELAKTGGSFSKFGVISRGINKITELPRVAGARFAAGPADELTKAITEGKFPQTPSVPTSPTAPITPAATAATTRTSVPSPLPADVQFPTAQTSFPRKPLEPQVIDNMLKGKAPAQSGRLIRDMRYKQGEFVPRGQQEAILRQAAKRKYR